MSLFDFLRKKKEIPPQHPLVQTAVKEGFMMYLENIRAAKHEFSDSDKRWLLRMYELDVPAMPGIESRLAVLGEVHQIPNGKYLLVAWPKVTKEQISDSVRTILEIAGPGNKAGYSALDKEVLA